MEAVSYADANGEWRNKKVSFKDVISGFVSQLKVGQDLTRVSLPAAVLYPFSMLETFAVRELSSFELLLGLNKISSPLERMIAIVAWHSSCLPMELWRKKPYNAVIGEIHECHLESPQFGNTYFLAEQVSHHPPISAVVIHNPIEGLTLSENLSFGVSFGGNSLSVITAGAAELVLGNLKETYVLDKMFPDMSVRHLVIGSKKIYWEGDITMTCSQSNLVARLKFYRDGDHSDMKGTITTVSSKEPLATFDGRCGVAINVAHGKEKKRLLIDLQNTPKSKIHLPMVSELDPMSSYHVWSSVNKLIVEDKLLEADEAKKKVEENQRLRIQQEGNNHQAKHFQRVGEVNLPISSTMSAPPITSSSSHYSIPSSSSSSTGQPISSSLSSSASTPVASKWELKESAYSSQFGKGSHH